VRRLRVNSAVSWGIGLAAWFLALLEILLRVYRPTDSLQYHLLRRDGLEPAIAALKVGYRAGSELAVWCGYLGTGLLLVAIIYPFFRRIRALSRVARNAFWFDFHMMAGTVGPMFILLHTALKLDNWVSLAFWSMVIVGLSGLMGRYLYTKVPDLYSGRELEELDHQRALARLRRDSPDAAALAEAEILAHRRRAERVAERVGLFGALWWIVAQDLVRPLAHLRRRLRLRRAAATRATARELAERTGRLLLIERRRVIAPRAQLVLHAWKWVHVPFALLMAVVASVHIWKAFIYSM
jgi:hypothetical protein